MARLALDRTGAIAAWLDVASESGVDFFFEFLNKERIYIRRELESGNRCVFDLVFFPRRV